MEIHDQVKLSDAVGMQGASNERRGGLPTREVARHVSERGDASGTDVERTEDGGSIVRRTVQPAGPSPRDAGGNRKREEELRAVELLLPAFNRLHGTAYDTLASGADERGEDVVVSSQRATERPVVFQLIFADTEGALRASISTGKAYAASGTEEQLISRFAKALHKKSLHPNREAILVLDGAGVTTAPGTVERLVRDCHVDLAKAPFREVWWVDHAPGGVVRRLWPAEAAGTEQ